MVRSLPLALLFLSPLLASPAQAAEGVELRDYSALKVPARVAADVNAHMQGVLLQVSVHQARLQKARADADDAASRYGAGSNEFALSQARYEQVRSDALEQTFDQLEAAGARLATASEATGGHVDKLLEDRAAFQAVVRAHLSGVQGPEITAVLLHLAIRKLHIKCQDLMSRTILSTLEGDLSEIEDTLRLIAQLDGGGAASGRNLDAIWEELVGERGDAPDLGPAPLDDLDRLLR